MIVNKIGKEKSKSVGTSEKGGTVGKMLRSGSANIIGALIVSVLLLAGLFGVYWYRAYCQRKITDIGEKVLEAVVSKPTETKRISTLPEDHINYEPINENENQLKESGEINEDVELDDETQKKIRAEVARHVSKVPIGEIGEN